jgi:hypothetical protein
MPKPDPAALTKKHRGLFEAMASGGEQQSVADDERLILADVGPERLVRRIREAG